MKSESEVTQSCPTLSDSTDYSLPGSSIQGIFQARVLDWGAIAFSQEETRTIIKAKDDPFVKGIVDVFSQNVTELRLSDNPAWEGDKGNTKGDKHDDLQRARFICPVVGLEMNGRHR